MVGIFRFVQPASRPTSSPSVSYARPSTSAFDAIYESLVSADRALLILATGLGKTVIGGKQAVARHLTENPQGKYWSSPIEKSLVEQLERALWHHIPKSIRTQLLTQDERTSDLRGVTCATVEAHSPTSARAFTDAGDGEQGALSYWRVGDAELLQTLDEVPRIRCYRNALAR